MAGRKRLLVLKGCRTVQSCQWVASQVADGTIIYQVQTQRSVAGDVADCYVVYVPPSAHRRDLEQRSPQCPRARDLEVRGIDAGHRFAEDRLEGNGRVGGLRRWRQAVQRDDVGGDVVDGLGLAGEVAVGGVPCQISNGTIIKQDNRFVLPIRAKPRQEMFG